jgi:uncharacterized protein YuzE
MNQFRPFAQFEAFSLLIVFRDPTTRVVSISVRVVVDLDEFGSPAGVEILNFEDQLGPGTAISIFDLISGSDVRFSYDPETDSAAIGVAVGVGTRTARSLSKTGTATLDGSKMLVALEVNDLRVESK